MKFHKLNFIYSLHNAKNALKTVSTLTLELNKFLIEKRNGKIPSPSLYLIANILGV